MTYTPVLGYALYGATKDGRVARLVNGGWRELRGTYLKGYRRVCLRQHGRKTYIRVSRLVLGTFLLSCCDCGDDKS